ncbi:hypothetical protein H0H93_012337, partial [Arthromyces matolae]
MTTNFTKPAKSSPALINIRYATLQQPQHSSLRSTRKRRRKSRSRTLPTPIPQPTPPASAKFTHSLKTFCSPKHYKIEDSGKPFFRTQTDFFLMQLVQRNTYVRVGDSDVETTDVESDELEVLVDTDNESPPLSAPPLTAQSSISSLGSGFESLDNFDDLSSSYSSFGLKSPTAGGSQGSPRKFRKLSPTSSITRTSSNASSSSNPRLLAIDDVFGSSSSVPRNNGWRTAPKSPTPIPATPPEDEDTILNAFIAAPLVLNALGPVGAWKGTGKPPADYIMTDGCGFINEAALKVIGRFLNLAGYPSAVQGRVFGAKGLWILHPTDTSPQPKIWIRHSQRKIVYESPIHRAHLIFDLLKTSKASPPVRLSPQSLLNLSENGVPDSVLVEVMRQALLDEVEPLMRWDGPQAMQLLYSVVDRLGHVSRTRLIKLTGGLSRALGLTGQDWGDDSITVEKEDENGQPSANDEAAAEQGRGSTSLAESIMEMLQAGFHPTESQFLRDKIRWLVTTTLKTIVDKFSIPVHDALNAFIVPDPLGVLKDGEVYYRSSEPVLRREEQSFFSVLTGDVLLGRYPVRLSSDIQKVKAVDHPKLAPYVDVLVVSTKGKMSFASTFSGGDYDGDLMFMLFMPSLLEHFRNRDLRTNPPDLMGKYFMEQPERVA